MDQVTSPLAVFPTPDGARVPYKVYSSDEIYALEQERIYRGPTWSFLGLEAEIPNPGDYKSTFVGDTPVVMTRGRGRDARSLGQSLRPSWGGGVPPAAGQRAFA